MDVVIDDDCTRIVMPQPMTMLRKGWYPTAFLSMRAAGPLTTIWRTYTMQKSVAQSAARERIVSVVPASLSDMSQVSYARPPFRRRASHFVVDIFELLHTL